MNVIIQGYLANLFILQLLFLKGVSGFSNDIFYGDGTLTHRPTPKLEGQALQFLWPLTQNLGKHG